MERKRIEIEAKFPLLNIDETINILKKVGKKTEESIRQIDTYYTPAHINFIEQKPIVKWLRVRKTDDENTINFKDWSNNSREKKIKCKEIEVGVDDYKGIKEILKSLDFTEIIVVDKTRTSFLYKDIIFSIDKIKDLGNFIELEYKNNIFEDEDESLKYILSILNELNISVGEQIFAGYPQLIMKKGTK